MRKLPFIYVSGGCRSGKSDYAEKTAKGLSPDCLYLATAEIHDEEMRERVLRHQRSRGEAWRLYESPSSEAPDLWQQLPSIIRPGEALLFDCLTLWIASCLQHPEMIKEFSTHSEKLLQSLWELNCPVVLVSNEVGMGVVPETPSGRLFRDMAGIAGQQAARLATNVVLMISGIPLAVKGELPFFS